ncbi:hypothetical protein Lal_00033953 [Lupinus albus]|nr:hypothetical protein Lal_00033953 [Lupinus albus]
MSTEQVSIGQNQVPNTSNVGESNSVPMNVDAPPIEDETHFSSLTDVEEARPKQISSIWNHFERHRVDGKWKAACNYCGKQLLGDPSQGTKHLHNHFKSCIRRSNSDIKQALLKTTKKRCALAKMIIFHEYPMSMVDHILFKEFCGALQPLFKGISHNTVKGDIIKMYTEERLKTMTFISKNQSRFAITTDIWTASNQNKGYMAITTHFIDDSWVLQSRLLNVRFIYVPSPHTSEVLSDCLYECLLDWNLYRKLSTLTVDNCTTNDRMIECMLSKISPRSFILGGQMFHMRCCAHILNLVVKDGLSIISSAVERVRDSVSFWTATPKREEKFKETCEQLNIQYDKKLELDCKTRWNSTFLMLHVALIYRDVFQRLSLRENLYKTLPSEDDWEMANEICQKLKLFYNVTLVYSGTLYPTANVLFPKICEIKLALVDWLKSTDLVIHQMAEAMHAKFENQSQTLNLIDVGADEVNVDWRAKYKSFVSEQNFTIAHRRSELEIYLEDGVLPDQGGEFDILAWWKINGIKYPTLQRIARDLLAIPISTVASESSFSTGGRILTPHRNRLRPDTVEALMCLQDWLRGDMKGSSNSKLDIIGCGIVLEDFDVSNDPTSQGIAIERE